MFQTIVSILPLDIASTLSPIIFALTILLLSSKHERKTKIVAFLIGSLLVGVFITFIGFHVGSQFSVKDKQTPISALIDIALGMLFFYFAVRALVYKDRNMSLDKKHHGNIGVRWMGIGILINITNFDAVILNLTAAKIVGAAEEIAMFGKMLLLSLNIFFFTLPVTLPIILRMLFPVAAVRVLADIKQFLMRYARYITAVLFFIFSIVFLDKGIQFFLR